jgi:glycosyltransferase involved in cell wall biosynthesis
MSRRIEVRVLANVLDPRDLSCETPDAESHCSVIRCWRRGSVTYPFKIFNKVFLEKPDIVHLQHGWLLYGDGFSPLLFPLLLLILHLTRKPLIVTMHTVIGEKPRLYGNRVINFMAKVAIMLLTKSIVKLSTRVIVHNDLMKRTLMEAYSLRRDGWKILVIPHGVKEVQRKPKKISGNKNIRILSLGFIRKWRGIEYLIEAFKIFSSSYPEATLVIAGGKHAHDDEEYIRRVKKKLIDEGVKNVVLTGFVDEETLDRLIQESEIIVLSSLASYYIEASGSLARIAMYGKPIICSRVPKFEADLEDGKDCIMVEMDDPKKLADALFILAKNVNLGRNLGRNLKKKFRDRVWSKVAEQHIKLFEGLL